MAVSAWTAESTQEKGEHLFFFFSRSVDSRAERERPTRTMQNPRKRRQRMPDAGFARSMLERTKPTTTKTTAKKIDGEGARSFFSSRRRPRSSPSSARCWRNALLAACALLSLPTSLASSPYLYSVLHPSVPEWHFQCLEFGDARRFAVADATSHAWERRDDDVVRVSVYQKNRRRPIPALACVAESGCCFDANETHALSPGFEVAVTSRNGTTHRATPKRAFTGASPIVVADARWPFCKGGGGDEKSGLDLDATCASPSSSSSLSNASSFETGNNGSDDKPRGSGAGKARAACIDICVDLLGRSRSGSDGKERVICHRASTDVEGRREVGSQTEKKLGDEKNAARDDFAAVWDIRPRAAIWSRREATRDEEYEIGAGWVPWSVERRAPSDTDAVAYDTPVAYVEHDPGGALTYVGKRGRLDAPLAFEAEPDRRLCLRPLFPRNELCHVAVHGVCYLFDLDESVRCVDLSGLPTASEVTLHWAPRLKRSPFQPGRSRNALRAFCLSACRGRVESFLACMEEADGVRPNSRAGSLGVVASSAFSLDGRDAEFHRRLTGRTSTIRLLLVPPATRPVGRRLRILDAQTSGRGTREKRKKEEKEESRQQKREDADESRRTMLWALTFCFCMAAGSATVISSSLKTRRRRRLETLATRVDRVLGGVDRRRLDTAHRAHLRIERRKRIDEKRRQQKGGRGPQRQRRKKSASPTPNQKKPLESDDE